MIMSPERWVLHILNDGRLHSDQALAAQLNINREAVEKIIRTLQGWGVEIQAVGDFSYRLAESIELLDQARIMDALEPDVRSLITVMEIHQCIDSTNTYLINRARWGMAGGAVCLAEYQLAGRGRRGRSWVSPFAANLYLSLLWRFPVGPARLSGLSLVTGVAVARALRNLGVKGVGLKWPNDVLWQQRKLGGVLLEFGGESSGFCPIVAGVGLNVAMPEKSAVTIDQPWIDLRSIPGFSEVSRNHLAAKILSEMIKAFKHFEQDGLEEIVDDWRRFDRIAGRRVCLILPNDSILGIARGVDRSGALLLETAGGIRSFIGGEISLRAEGNE